MLKESKNINRLTLVPLNMALFFFFIIISFIIPKLASADMLDPGSFSEKCNFNEVPRSCLSEGTSVEPVSGADCEKYKGNPTYRYLTNRAGLRIYCYKHPHLTEFISYHGKSLIFLLGMTFLFELLVFLIADFTKRREILAIAVANLITVPLFYFAKALVPTNSLLFLILLELGVIWLEIIIIRKMLPNIDPTKIKRVTILANIVSAFAGVVMFVIQEITNVLNKASTRFHQ